MNLATSMVIVTHLLILLLIHVFSLHVLVDDVILLRVEVEFFDWANLLVQSLDLKLVSMHLGLVVLELLDHFFELHWSLLQVLLVNHQLFCNFWAWLLRQDVLQLDVQFLFLLDQHVFLAHLLCLRDQALLETLYFLDHLVSLWVSAFKLSPSVHVERLLKLITQVFGLLLLLESFLFQEEDLPLQIRDAHCLVLGDDELPFDLSDLLLDV